MSQIGGAPIQKPIEADRSWVQWLSEIGNALNGRWGQEKRTLTKINIDPEDEPDEEYLNYKGRELSFLFVWNDGIVFSGSSISLNQLPGQADLTMRPGMLQIWEGSTLVGGAYANERTIELPNLSLAGRVIVQGSIMTKTTDPRRV